MNFLYNIDEEHFYDNTGDFKLKRQTEVSIIEDINKNIIHLKETIVKYFNNGIFLLNFQQFLESIEYNFHKQMWYIELKEKDNVNNIIKKEDNRIIQKNNYNIFNIAMVEKIYHINTEYDNIYSILNEYLTGIYCLNYLRLIIPNFVFIFNCNLNRKVASLSLEYINGITFEKYLEYNINKERNNEFIQIFLNIFFQIIFSIELAQRYFHFNHNDLHLKNIMVQYYENPISIEYPILNNKPFTMNTKYIARIIDYEYSSTTYKKTILANKDIFIEYGYVPFFTPAKDILRFCLSIYCQVIHYKENTNGFFIKNFLNIIMEKFFRLNLNEKNLIEIKKWYLNLIGIKQIFYNPLQLIVFMEQYKEKIVDILKINDFPYRVGISHNFNFFQDYNLTQELLRVKPLYKYKIQNYIFTFNNNVFKFHDCFDKKQNNIYELIQNIKNIPLITFKNKDKINIYFFLKENINILYEYEKLMQIYYNYEISNYKYIFMERNFVLFTYYYRLVYSIFYYYNFLNSNDVENINPKYFIYLNYIQQNLKMD